MPDLCLVDDLPTVVSVVLVAGIATGALNPILGAVAYERIPPDLLARVFGAVGALAWAGIPLGGLVAGGLVGWLGLGGAFTAMAALYFLATLAPFVGRSWRDMDRRRPANPPSDTEVSAALTPASSE